VINLLFLQRIFQFIERYFWLFFLLGLGAGFVFPQYGESFRFLLEPALMLMLLLVFLKLDFHEIFMNIRNFRLMTYLSIFLLILVPIATYFIFKRIDETLAIGFLLLAAMPPGTASPALTDLLKGNVELSVGTLIVCSLLAPLTIPFFTISSQMP